MADPNYLSNYLLRVGKLENSEAQALVAKLKTLDGVADVVIIPEDEIAYLKVDLQQVDQEALDGYAVQG
jgi:hypothetical protein